MNPNKVGSSVIHVFSLKNPTILDTGSVLDNVDIPMTFRDGVLITFP